MSEILLTSGREILDKPAENDEWFKVDPPKINWKLFEKERKNRRQEAVRELIKKAQRLLEGWPEKYGRKFETRFEYFGEVNEYQSEFTEVLIKLKKLNSIAELSAQAFEIAQRLSNGETWEKLCNNPDSYKYPRLIIGDSYETELRIHRSKFYYLFGGEELGSPANYRILIPDDERIEYSYKSGSGGGDTGPIGERYVSVNGEKIDTTISLLLVRYLDTYETKLEKMLKEMPRESMITYKW